MDERWTPIREYEGLYEVSTAGRVRSFPRSGTRGGVLRPDLSNTGYLAVRLYKKNATKHLNVHALVATAFHGPRPEGYECRHLNGDRTDNRLENLRWGTSLENSQDMIAHGRTNARITHCPQGHEYSTENTYIFDGRRYCRACNRKYTRDRQRRVRANQKALRDRSET